MGRPFCLTVSKHTDGKGNSMRKTMNLILLFAAVCLSISLTSTVSAEEELTFAAVLPLTGPLATGGTEGFNGQRDCIAIINEDGGIYGKKLRYVIEDGQFKPDVGMAAFQKIMASENPLIFVAQSTEMAKSLAPEFKDRYKMLLGSTGSSSELAYTAMNPYLYVTGPTDGDQLGILLKYIAKEKPGATVAFFYSDTEFGRNPIKFGRLLCERLRLRLVAEEVVPMGAKDLKAQISDLKSTNPDYVIFHGFLFEPVPQVMKVCRDLGMKSKFMGTFYGASKWMLDKLGPLAEGYLAVNPYEYWWNDDVPMIKKIRDYTERTYPDVKFRDVYYMRGFMSVMIVSECMRRAAKAGELNREGVAMALQTIKDFDSGGLSAPWTIHNNRFPVAKVWLAKPEKGVYEPASDWIRLDKY
jgi:branched-chain amino acid transport system substrate-binding protein